MPGFIWVHARGAKAEEPIRRISAGQLQGIAVMSGNMTNEHLDEVRRMIRQAVEAGRPYLDEDRCTGLVEAADRGDLSTVHDLLVEGMIELRGIGYTRRLLQEVDSKYQSGEVRSGLVH